MEKKGREEERGEEKIGDTKQPVSAVAERERERETEREREGGCRWGRVFPG